jgi:phosphoribosylamine--glycine ligase
MGAVAPLTIPKALETTIQDQIVKPFIQKLQRDTIDYRGVIYFGLMITKDGPKVVEINVRFGDPEAQVILPLLEGDWGHVFYSIAKGEIPDLRWKNLSVACVVMAASGYPDNPNKGDIIEGSIFQETPSSYFIHAGVSQNENKDFIVTGGRVLGAMGVGTNVHEALEHAYHQVERVTWPGVLYRKDIGQNLPVKF